MFVICIICEKRQKVAWNFIDKYGLLVYDELTRLEKEMTGRCIGF